MQVDLYNLIINEKGICVKISEEFKNLLINQIKEKFHSLSNYQKIKRSNIKYITLKAALKRGKTISIKILLYLIQDLDINKEELYKNIIYFRLNGGRINCYIPRYIKLDKQFIKGFSLYLAEGDTGLSGKTIPDKFRLTNTDLPIIFYFRNIILNYFNQKQEDIKYYIYLPKNYKYTISEFCKLLNVNKNNLHIYYDNTVTIPKYRISLERKIFLLIFLKLDIIIKNLCLNNSELASAYLEGLSAGEGTAYCNKMKYVRIEMKNPREMKYVSSLLNLLNINHKLYERNTRKNMWNVCISRKENLDKFAKLIGFSLCKKRQDILDKIVNSYLLNSASTS
ncbi:MAG: LAGLIDADG family homing endonuclease [Candidatus Nanoarchaeia archaeon]|nr:LAGLIDADG family homing endonuclease [Candidatus Nanoarchaeia archaeon]